MLFGVELDELIKAIGVLGVAAIVFAESGLLIGFFLPGDTLLFTAGFLAHEQVLATNVHVLAFVLFLAAVAGDSVGYAFGRRVGRRIFRKPDSLLFHQDNLERAEKFYEKYGAATIVIARFVPIVRTFAPIVAGVGKMHYRKFLSFNIIGGALWAAGLTYLGYYGGRFLESRGIEVDHLILPVIAFAMFVTIASPVYHIIREPKSRAIVMRKIKAVLQKRKAVAKDKE